VVIGFEVVVGSGASGFGLLDLGTILVLLFLGFDHRLFEPSGAALEFAEATLLVVGRIGIRVWGVPVDIAVAVVIVVRVAIRIL
jgi:hypothetical protein